MVLRRDAAGPLHQVDVLEQRHHMAGAGLRDGLVQAGKRADVNHADHRSGRLARAEQSRPAGRNARDSALARCRPARA